MAEKDVLLEDVTYTKAPVNTSEQSINSTVVRLMFYEFEMSLCKWSNPVYGVISIPSVLLNGLAVFLLCSIKQKKPIAYFLLSLALSDIICSAINIYDIIRDPTCVHRYYDRYYVTDLYSAEKCIVTVTSQFQFIGCYAMLGTMIGMTVDRMLAVLQPLRHRQHVTSGRVKVAIIVVWVMAVFLGSFHFILGLSHDDPSENTFIKTVEKFIYDVNLPILFTAAFLTLGFFLCAYGLIFCQIKRTLNAMPKAQSTSVRKSCITILLIVGTFAFTWLPYGAMTFWYIRNPCNPSAPNYERCYKVMRYNFEITMSLVYLNSLFDPLIYIVRDKYVNRALKSILRQSAFFSSPGGRESLMRAQLQTSSRNGVRVVANP